MSDSESVCDILPGVLSIEQAIQRLLASVQPVEGVERLSLQHALGRVLPRDVASPLDLPLFTSSAMDGYAVRACDALPGARLRMTGSAFAGHPFSAGIGQGECVRILTGACLPTGADAVVVQELTEKVGDEILLKTHHPLRIGANIRYQGEELKSGQTLIAGGKVLRPADIGLLALAGCQEVDVRVRPKVAFIATGDELVEPGQILEPGFINESNRPVLRAMLTELGMEPMDLGLVRDDPRQLAQVLLSGVQEADLIIAMGGASVGDADYLTDVVQNIGQLEFWKVNIKPGKPFLFGRLAGRPLFGLPGNPVSMMVTFMQLARPALLRMAGRQPDRLMRLDAISTCPMHKSPGRLEFRRAIVQLGREGCFVTPVEEQGSHQLTGMSRANSFILLPADCENIEAGERVTVELFDGERPDMPEFTGERPS